MVSDTPKDDGRMADEMMKRSEFLEYMQAFEERFTNRMDVQFEETRGLIRLSLEGLEALRETTERGFADVRRENHENRTLLEEVVKHVRKRVERVEDARRAKRLR
jgi:hypothetical protein